MSAYAQVGGQPNTAAMLIAVGWRRVSAHFEAVDETEPSTPPKGTGRGAKAVPCERNSLMRSIGATVSG